MGWSAVFDEPNLVSHAGLVPAMGLAARAGLIDLADRHLTVPDGPGHGAGLRGHGGRCGFRFRYGRPTARRDARVVLRVRAPSTVGTFLRAFRFGHVRQLDAVAARFLAGLTRHAPLIPTTSEVTFVDKPGRYRLPQHSQPAIKINYSRPRSTAVDSGLGSLLLHFRTVFDGQRHAIRPGSSPLRRCTYRAQLSSWIYPWVTDIDGANAFSRVSTARHFDP